MCRCKAVKEMMDISSIRFVLVSTFYVMSPLEYTRRTHARTLIKVIRAEIILSYFLGKAQPSKHARSLRNQNKYVSPAPSPSALLTLIHKHMQPHTHTDRNNDRLSLRCLLRHISTHKSVSSPKSAHWTSTLSPPRTLWTPAAGGAKAPCVDLEEFNHQYKYLNRHGKKKPNTSQTSSYGWIIKYVR